MGTILENVTLPTPILVLVMVPPTQPLSIIISIKRGGITKNNHAKNKTKHIKYGLSHKEAILTTHVCIKGQYDLTFDLKINIGLCALYFMVQ